MDELNHLRHELLAINQQFFHIIEQRKDLVHAIQSQKFSAGQTVFCPEREWELFNQLANELKRLSIRELLAFSLVIEEDARSFNDTYPAWSEGQHLARDRHQNITQNIIELINPILLKVAQFDHFKDIQLNSDFDFIYHF